MKSSKKTSENPSRRGFAKSIAAAIVAAPILSSLSACDPSNKAGNTNTAPSPEQTVRPLSGDPPIIVDGGSLHIDTSLDLTQPTQTSKRLVAPASSKVMSGAIIITGRKTDIAKDSYSFDDTKKCKLNLWLQYKTDKPDPDPFPAQLPDPHIVIASATDGTGFTIDSDSIIPGSNYQSPDDSLKKSRRKRYNHPGHGQQKFRIWGWQITESGGTVLRGANLDNRIPGFPTHNDEDEDYRLMIFFI